MESAGYFDLPQFGLSLVSYKKYHPIEVHFGNQRTEEALHTKFGANRNTPRLHFKKLQGLSLVSYDKYHPIEYIFGISASRRPYIPNLGQIEIPRRLLNKSYNKA